MHKPVLLNEVVTLALQNSPTTILDGTFGRGGHTRALLRACPDAKVWAIDRDHAAIAHAQVEFQAELAQGRLHVQQFNFHDIRALEKPATGFDYILLDLGVSSPQLDESARGFSFYHDGPLDMRMDQSQDFTAADIVNTWSEVELIELFQELGEVRRPQRVVKAIVTDRKLQPYSTTKALADLMARIEGWRKKGHHPATNYFLALRMAVNRELSGLEAGLTDLIQALSPKGRLAIITFHSLEDRLIKYAFKEATELGSPLYKKVIVPTREEVSDNPRSRSAKLRVFQRGGTHAEPTPKGFPPVL
jgi:16S rRNA (cytosine1402-N4)-methyltransferase